MVVSPAVSLTGFRPGNFASAISTPVNRDWIGARVATDKATLVNGIWYVAECDAAKLHAVSRHAFYDQWRFEVRSGDQWASDSASVNRAELDGFPAEYPASATLWGSYSFMIEPGDVGALDAYIGQLHQTTETGYDALDPPLAFNIVGSTLKVVTRTDNGSPPSGNPAGVTRYAFDPVRGRWYNVVFKVKVDPAGAGLLSVWIDGTQVVNLTGIATGFNAAGNYWKFGAYRSADTATFAIRYANMEFGTTDLSARATSPLALNTAKAAVASTPLDGLTITAAYSASRALISTFNAYPLVAVNDAVSSFRDQVSTQHIVQATAAYRPALTTVGGRLAADFDGTDDIMSAGATWTNFMAVGAGYACFSIYPDAITSNSATVYNNHCIFGDSGDYLGLFLKSGATANAYNYDGTVDSPTGVAITAGAPHTVEWRHTGGSLDLRVDGGSWSSVASGNTSGGSTLNIGGNVNAAATQAFNGKIAEFVFCQTVPSSTNQDNIRAALAAHIGGT